MAMPQDRESGARASQYGLECGKRIIDAIGAKSIRPGSNECLLHDELMSVHCAHRDNASIGVTYKALERIAAVLGAFEQEDGSYVVLRIPKKQYKELMKDTRSRGPARNRVGIVRRTDFERCGTLFATVPASKQSNQHEARVREILATVKPLAVEYYQLTRKPLGVTGEISEYVAAETLGLTLVPARTVGYDALRGTERIQIKGRAYGKNAKPGQRMSRIKTDAPCNTVLLVLLDNATLDPREMWEAPFKSVVKRLAHPGSKARERGVLGVSEFKRLPLARRVWPDAETKVSQGRAGVA
jgi:hypothetical protein